MPPVATSFADEALVRRLFFFMAVGSAYAVLWIYALVRLPRGNRAAFVQKSTPVLSVSLFWGLWLSFGFVGMFWLLMALTSRTPPTSEFFVEAWGMAYAFYALCRLPALLDVATAQDKPLPPVASPSLTSPGPVATAHRVTSALTVSIPATIFPPRVRPLRVDANAWNLLGETS